MGLGAVAVGSEGVRHPGFGLGICIHELGHQVSYFLKTSQASDHSRTKYEQIKSCLVGQHPEKGAQYFEEDFADIIYAEGSIRSGLNKWCHIFNNKAILTDRVRSFASFKNGNPEDPHSGLVFRLVNTEQYRADALPQSCGLAAEAAKIPFKKCL